MALQAAHAGNGVPGALSQLKQLVATKLQAPPALHAELVEKAQHAGIIQNGDWDMGTAGNRLLAAMAMLSPKS